MDEKEGINPMLRKTLGGNPELTDPMSGLGSITNSNYGMGVVPNEQGAAAPPPEAAPIAEPTPAGIEGVVTAPHERKMGFLGKLIDGLGAMYGQEPKFRQAHQHKQMIDAMEGFADDPIAAIKKVAKINPMAAEKMYGKYVDDQRQAGEAEERRKLNALRYQGIGLDRIASMAGAVRPDGSNWGAMRPVLQNYATDKGIDVIIPEQWDPDMVNIIRFGGIKPDQQVDNARADRTLEHRQDVDAARLEDADLTRQAGDQRNTDRIAAQNERSRLSREAVDRREAARLAAGGKPKPGAAGAKGGYVTKVIRDSQGNQRKIVFTPDGKRAMGKVGDQTVWYNVQGGQLVPDKTK